MLAHLLGLSLALSMPCWDELKDISVTPQSNITLWNMTHRVNNPDWYLVFFRWFVR